MYRFYNEKIAISQILKLGFVFVAIFAFFIQFHGKVSPGGGFQSGIVLAILLIAYELLLLTFEERKSKLKDSFFVYIAAFGVLIYAFIGLVGFVLGGLVFDYRPFNHNNILAQQIGIFFIESGVGLAVFGSMMTIYRSLILSLTD